MAKKTDEFDKWLDDDSHTDSRKKRSWEEWPKQMGAELARVVERNDSTHSRRVTLVSLLDRWESKYKRRPAKDTIGAYCRVVLGRKSFAKA